MQTGLEIIGISSLALLLLVILFHIETVKGGRIIFEGVRSLADRGVLWVQSKSMVLSHHFGTGSFRIMLYYVLNSVLVFLRARVQQFEKFLTRVVTHNRRAARTIVSEKSESHLSIMAEHKKATELSEEEKTKLKKEMLDG